MLFFWLIVIVVALLAYVILDGYDLGIGVLTLFQRDAARRRRMIEVVGNVWDGNESWLILLAMGLWGGMPDAYATALPGLYLPLLVMIFALIFRGFAVEMTLQRGASDRTWTRLFGIGSFVAAFAQGVLFGGLLCGVTVRHGVFAGGTWDFFGHGYAVLTGLLTVTLFSLAGAARLQAKTDGALRDQMGAIVRPLTLATVVGVAVSAALLPVATSAQLRLGGVDRWLPFGYAVLVAAAGFWTSYRRAGRTPDGIPFAAVAAAEAAGLVALLALFYPQIVPPSVTLYSSAASRETIDFLVIAIGVLLPLTIAYHVYANWVFRGRQPLDGAMVPHGPATARAVIRSVAPGRPAAPSRPRRPGCPGRNPPKEDTDMEPDTVRTPDGAAGGTARPGGDRKWPWPARLLVTVALLPVGAAVILAAENDLAFIGSWFDPLMIALMIATVIVAWTSTGRSQR